MKRREFLAASGAVLAAGRISPADDAAAGGGVIDAHSHIWTRDVAKYPLAPPHTVDDLAPPSFTAEELLELVRPHGVTRIVLIQHRPYHGIDNSYITDTIARYPGVFSAVACIDAGAARPDREMDRLKELGVRGIRIRPGEGGADRWLDSEGMRSIWARAAGTGIAVCPLINPENLPEVDATCERYPDTTVVVDHFARIGIDGMIREADIRNLTRLARHRRTHVKVSAFYALGKKRPPHTELIPMIRRLCDAFGPERLMWASDCPYQVQGENTYADSLALIRERIDFLSDTDRQRLLHGTAEKVYFA